MKGTIAIFSLLLFACCNENVDVKDAELSQLEFLNRSILESPNSDEVYLERAKYFFEKEKKTEEALRDIKRCFAIDSSNAEVFILEGKIYSALGQSAKAKFSWLEAIKKSPENIEARLELAQFYASLTNYQKAIDLTNEALQIDRNNAKSYLIKGLVYRKAGNDSLAVSSIQTAVEVDSKLMNGYIYLGMIYGEKNDPLAIEYYKSALDLDPNNQQVLYALAYFYQENGNYKEALDYYDRLTTVDGSNAFASFNKGFIHLVYLEQLDSAIFFFTETLKKDPKYYAAYYNRGFAYEQLNKFKDARLDYQAALTIEHNYPLAIEGMNRLDDIQK
nr:hypothetical protein [uncultured bacterium]